MDTNYNRALYGTSGISAKGLGINNDTTSSNSGTTTNKSSLDNSEAAGKTNRGTRIVKKGQETDKNMFLKILSAQMKNQDPTGQSNNSTDFVGQMAQFSSLEQMSNLNKTMTELTATSMIGKGVDLNIKDDYGNPMVGIVRVTQQKNGEPVFGVEVNKNGKSEIIEVAKNNIVSSYDLPDYNMENLNVTTGLMYASSMIGKIVEIPKETSTSTSTTSATGTSNTGSTTGVDNTSNTTVADSTTSAAGNGSTTSTTGTGSTTGSQTTNEVYRGKVIAAFRDKEGLKVTVDLGNGEKKDFIYSQVTKIEGSN